MEELPGIINWAIKGCLEWPKNELQTPQISEDQVAEYKSAMDSISQFIQDECEVGKDHSYAASKFFQLIVIGVVALAVSHNPKQPSSGRWERLQASINIVPQTACNGTVSNPA